MHRAITVNQSRPPSLPARNRRVVGPRGGEVTSNLVGVRRQKKTGTICGGCSAGESF